MVSIRDGRLFADDVAASDLVERFGSPLFASSETQLRANLRRITAVMAAEWPEWVDVLPAFKANPMMRPGAYSPRRALALTCTPQCC